MSNSEKTVYVTRTQHIICTMGENRIKAMGAQHIISIKGQKHYLGYEITTYNVYKGGKTPN